MTSEPRVRPPEPASLAPYDAVLLQSFGGPEAPEEVMPFLENVVRGRNVPRDRLLGVAEHYQAFGGRSPINDQNRALLAALVEELAARGLTPPIFWGNRNWEPYLVDALREARDSGARRVLTVVTSAYSSYSGCRQYREDRERALESLAAGGGPGDAMVVDKIRGYFNHPGFAEATVDAVMAAHACLEPDRATPLRVLFVTHSIPMAMQEGSGPGGGAYSRQHRDLAATVMDVVARRLGRGLEWDLVYCSRSGPPQVPWLEPDINDHLEDVAANGVRGVVVVPIGFISDHMEVIYDLDTEAADVANRLGLDFARAATVGTHPAFVAGLVDLLLERAAEARGERRPRVTVGGLEPLPAQCPADCCRPGGRPGGTGA